MNRDKAHRIAVGVDPESSLLYFTGPRQTTLDSEYGPSIYGLFKLKLYEYSQRLVHTPTNTDMSNKEGKFILYFDNWELGGPYTSKQLVKGIKNIQQEISKLLPDMEIKERVATALGDTDVRAPTGIILGHTSCLYQELKNIAKESFE